MDRRTFFKAILATPFVAPEVVRAAAVASPATGVMSVWGAGGAGGGGVWSYSTVAAGDVMLKVTCASGTLYTTAYSTGKPSDYPA
jgi:hypothetical protein